ncbi:MAG: hypothetical protein WAW52_01205 [Methanothrix sp.]
MEKSAKTIAIGGVKLINEDVHHDYMEIRDAVEGKEHCYTDDGEEICCPVCGTAWLTEIDGVVDFEICDHLRFSLNSDRGDDFEIFNDWDSESFLKLVEKAREKDDEADILDILNEIQHPDVDMAILYVWTEDPLNHPWMLWGYKSN